MNFNYNLPVNLVFGRGKVEELGTIASAYGKKALIVTGRGSTKKSGLLGRAIALLEAAGMSAHVFDKVMQNPLTTTAIEGAEFAKEIDCDVIVGIGGGSIMDCAKAIALLAVNDGDVNDYIFARVQATEALPIILVPTTCGTGSEGNGFAVLTNPENGDKKSIRANCIIAKASIIDSTLMETMPKSILASVGFDALCHNIEAYLSKITSPLVENMAVYAMQLIGESLPLLYKGEGTDEDWDKLSLGSTIGGMVIGCAGVTVSHGMEHPASGLRDIVHGRGLAALTPVIMAKTTEQAQEKCTVISKALGGTDYTDCTASIIKLLEDINLRVTLGEQGILEEDIPWMVENFYRVSAAGHANHPVTYSKEEVAEIFKLAL